MIVKHGLSPEQIQDHLSHIYPSNRLTINQSELANVSHDESTQPPQSPLAMAFPISTSEIAHTVRWANKYTVPITPRGAGSGLSGNAIPTERSVVLDVSQMDRVLQTYPDDLQVLVQPGIPFEKLNAFLEDFGLFFPPSPGGSSDVATIGGMVATNASGIYSVKYGGTREWVNSLTIVTGEGRVVKLGSRSLKRTSGYELMHLLIGSEGTLGIITEINLQLAGIPEERKRLVYSFPNELAAVEAVTEIKRYGLDVAALEYLDRRTVEAMNDVQEYELDVAPYLFIEAHGLESAVKVLMEYVSDICLEKGGQVVTLPGDTDPWEIRHYVTPSIKLRRPECTIIRNDTSVPPSKLIPLVEFAYKEAEALGIEIYVFGHLGIGILHVLILANEGDHDTWNAANQLNELIISEGIKMGGSTSGEHGIGVAHRFQMAQEVGPALMLMEGIKKVFDPNGILNPDKILYK